MTGDDDGELVGGTGGGDSPGGVRFAEPAGQLGVGDRLAGRNLAQQRPDPALEDGSLQVERQVLSVVEAVQAGDQLRDPLPEFVNVRLDRRVWEAGRNELLCGIGIVSQFDQAEAALGGCDCNPAESALDDGCVEPLTPASVAIGGRCHAEGLSCGFVDGTGGLVAGGVQGAGDRFAALQVFAEPFGPGGVGVFAGCHAEGSAEQSVQVTGTQADRAGEIVERRRCVRGIDGPADGEDGIGNGADGLPGPALAAGAVAVALGEDRGGEELDVGAVGTAGGADGTTIDAGCADGVEERSVGFGIAVEDGLVTPVIREAQTKSLLQISREVKDMAARAKDKKLADICFVLNIEDSHTVNYALKKLTRLGLVAGDKRGKEIFYATTKDGQGACEKYREVREDCLVSAFSAFGGEKAGELNEQIGEAADLLRALSGLYDQAARSASSL